MKYSNIKRVDNYLFQYPEDFSFCIETFPEYVIYDMILSRCNKIDSDYYLENSALIVLLMPKTIIIYKIINK